VCILYFFIKFVIIFIFVITRKYYLVDARYPNEYEYISVHIKVRDITSKIFGVEGNQQAGKSDLGPVCFQEFIFLETIFFTFPCLVSMRKSGQRKLNSVNGKKSLHARKVFSFPYSKENTFLFSKRALTSNDCKGLIW